MTKWWSVPAILSPFLPKILCEWTSVVAPFNAKTEQALAGNVLSFSHIGDDYQLQSYCLGHQLGEVITSRNSIICVPVGPYDHCRANLPASCTSYFMSVHSFIQLILIEFPQGNWQRDNASVKQAEEEFVWLTCLYQYTSIDESWKRVYSLWRPLFWWSSLCWEAC